MKLLLGIALSAGYLFAAGAQDLLTIQQTEQMLNQTHAIKYVKPVFGCGKISGKECPPGYVWKQIGVEYAYIDNCVQLSGGGKFCYR